MMPLMSDFGMKSMWWFLVVTDGLSPLRKEVAFSPVTCDAILLAEARSVFVRHKYSVCHC